MFVSVFKTLIHLFTEKNQVRAVSFEKNVLLYPQIVLSPMTKFKHGHQNIIKRNDASKKYQTKPKIKTRNRKL